MNIATLKDRIALGLAAGVATLSLSLVSVVPASAATATTKKTCVQKTYGVGNADNCVKNIQIMVNQSGWGSKTKLKADSRFGSKTKASVLAYQKHYKNIYHDGIVGPQTWSKLCNDAKVIKSGSAGAKAAKDAGCSGLKTKTTTASGKVRCHKTGDICS